MSHLPPPPSLDTPLPPWMSDRMILQSWIILTAHGSWSYVCNLLGACDNLQAATVPPPPPAATLDILLR